MGRLTFVELLLIVSNILSGVYGSAALRRLSEVTDCLDRVPVSSARR